MSVPFDNTSGWPEDDMLEEAKQDYIQKYFNPGLRTLAKFLFDEFLFNNMSVPFDNTSVPF